MAENLGFAYAKPFFEILRGDNQMLFTDKHGGMDFAKDPAVIKLGDTYFMYYTTFPNEQELKEGANLMIGMAKSADMEN